MGHFQSIRGIKVRHFTATHILTGSFACLKCCTRRAYFEIPNNVSSVVGPKKQIFWPKINIQHEQKKSNLGFGSFYRAY